HLRSISHPMPATTSPRPTMPGRPCVGPRCHSRYFAEPPAVAMMSMSGAFDARTNAIVEARPPRPSGVPGNVRPNKLCVRLSNQPNLRSSRHTVLKLVRLESDDRLIQAGRVKIEMTPGTNITT